MAEHIDKKQALNALESLRGVLGDAGTDAAKKLISGLHDPMIRCKDCRYAKFESKCSKYYCLHFPGCFRYANDFCSYGERKEG